jgi:hypothetical protein
VTVGADRYRGLKHLASLPWTVSGRALPGRRRKTIDFRITLEHRGRAGSPSSQPVSLTGIACLPGAAAARPVGIGLRDYPS